MADIAEGLGTTVGTVLNRAGRGKPGASGFESSL
jgi:hypothetical protein